MVFEKAACKYCSDEIAINSLARHEAKCQNKTPEQRHQAKVARQYAATVTRRPKGAAKPAGTGVRGSGKWVHKYTECEHCHDRIDVAFMTRHQKMCAAQTPEEREHEKQKRQRQRESYAQNESRRKEANIRRTGNPRRIKHPVLPALRGLDLDEPVVRPHQYREIKLQQSKTREYQRQYQADYAERRRANSGKPLGKLAAATRHARRTLAHSHQGNGFITFTVKVERGHLLTLLAKMAQADSSLVSIETEDFI
jgi:hypothetical protein